MTDPPRPDAPDDAGSVSDLGSTTGPSRPKRVVTTWQKVVGIIFLVLVVVFVILKLAGVGGGIGGHGSGGSAPGQNTPVENQEQETDTGDGGGHVPPPWVPDHDGDGRPG